MCDCLNIFINYGYVIYVMSVIVSLLYVAIVNLINTKGGIRYNMGTPIFIIILLLGPVGTVALIVIPLYFKLKDKLK